MPSPKTKYNLLRILQFIFLWLLFGMLYAVVEFGLIGFTGIYPTTQNIYDPSDSFFFVFIGTLGLGAIVGFMETYGNKNTFRNVSFAKKILLKSIAYLAIIVLFLISFAFIANANIMEKSMLDQEVINSVLRFATNLTFLTIVTYIGVMFIIILFFAEIRNYLGMFAFANFITGKYHKPREEDRIFMFMDMKSSTSIAEELGHIKYYNLLNQYYSDMSDAIINTHGEIYQYVGDEVIISWPLKEGLNGNNCIRCFYEIKLILTKKEAEYNEKYGLVPQFKAALHAGKVTTGEIGLLKKEIVFTGDVLNTTSRIQDKCNEFNAELLVSGDLYDELPDKSAFQNEPLGSFELKGKHAKINIHKISL